MASNPRVVAPAPEPDTVAGGKAFVVYVVGVVVMLAGIGVSTWLLARDRAPENGRLRLGPRTERVMPRTVGALEQTLVRESNAGRDLSARKRRELDQYGWVDKNAGIARIPVERAIEIVASGPNP